MSKVRTNLIDSWDRTVDKQVCVDYTDYGIRGPQVILTVYLDVWNRQFRCLGKSQEVPLGPLLE